MPQDGTPKPAFTGMCHKKSASVQVGSKNYDCRVLRIYQNCMKTVVFVVVFVDLGKITTIVTKSGSEAGFGYHLAPKLGNFEAKWDQIAAKLRPSWDKLGQVGPSWCQVGQSWRKKGQDFGHDGRKWR